MRTFFRSRKRDLLLVGVFAVLSAALLALPTGFEDRIQKHAVRCRGRVVDTENAHIQQFGMVKQGEQTVILEILDGPFKGRILEGLNPLMGQMDRDKVFRKGDIALVVLSVTPDGDIRYVNPQSHYRLGTELFLLILFALLLLAFGAGPVSRPCCLFCFQP